MSGEITITPAINWVGDKPTSNANLALTAAPTARVTAGAIGSRELDPDFEISETTGRATLREDFLNVNDSVSASSTGTVGSAKLSVVTAAVTSIGVATVAGAFGTLQCQIAVISAASAARIGAGSGVQCKAGSGEISMKWRIQLSDAANLTTYVGLMNPASTYTEPTDGCYFAYAPAVNSAHWQAKTANASTRTTVNHSAGPANGTWTTVEVVINAARTSVEFFIDGVSIGTSITNLPAAATGLALGLIMGTDGAGAGSAAFYVDYLVLSAAIDAGR